ncbi:uncharacterized protein LOC121368995 [Gigantopelta aegis]|uniref:uncharacterized protein LOC121368995 n=1 Tax=Gigantopelta aegis TaxID=1735272 RepID=UPI001B88A9C4|nr:uncharacterized protein LOC121368995 [Gigantopelta aegis]
MRIEFTICTVFVVLLPLWIADEVQCRLCQQCGDSGRYKACKYGRVEPTLCKDNQTYCATFAVSMDKNAGPYIARSCTSFNGSICNVKTLFDGRSVAICRKSCDTDGCNQGEWEI